MSKIVWKQLGSPDIDPFSITLSAYHGPPSQTKCLYPNVPIELKEKTILIDVKVIKIQLDYNILFGKNYMYSMKFTTSFVFITILFPHNDNIVTIE
jgi:hypothetical protein